MRKFGEIYKEKLNEAASRHEAKILEDFKTIYSAMLEHYGLTSVHHLDDESQISFLTELNHYWSEEKGLSEKGLDFLEKRSASLNENSTVVQKKNFLKTKSYTVLSETFRQTNLKYRLYDVIDEMYKSINANDLSEVLSPDAITNIVSESFNEVFEEFMSNITKELKESAKPKKYFVRLKLNENKRK